MSFRPTIAVYLNGKIVDIGYYRNWFCESVFYEAVAIYALYSDCKTAEEYLDRKYHAREICYLVSPERFRNTEEDLKFLESCSELPVIVDLTAHAIYSGYQSLSGKECLECRQQFEISDIREDLDYDRLLDTGWVPMEQADCGLLLLLFWQYTELNCRLSDRTYQALEERMESLL